MLGSRSRCIAAARRGEELDETRIHPKGGRQGFLAERDPNDGVVRVYRFNPLRQGTAFYAVLVWEGVPDED